MMLSRRELLVSSASLAALGSSVSVEASQANPTFRIVHLTDLHLRAGQGAREGAALAVKKIMALDPLPDFAAIGGDLGDGLMGASESDGKLQYQWAKEVLKPLEIPTHYVVGNHDIIGWAKSTRGSSKDPEGAKARYLETFGEDSRFKIFTHKGFQVIVLDSIQPSPDGSALPYSSKIDDEQMTWLKSQLEAGKGKPVILIVHSPILSGYFMYNDGPYRTPAFPSLVENAKEVHEILKGFDIPLVLQGHTHVAEDLIYSGRHHITSGAVCGDWWRGKRLGVDPEGFSVVDIYPDRAGLDRVAWQYIASGWTAKP